MNIKRIYGALILLIRIRSPPIFKKICLKIGEKNEKKTKI